MPRSLHDPDGLRLPIKLDSTSNGEFEPVPLEPVHHYANALALESATTHSRRLGQSRRDFLVSMCGAASTLLAMNTAFLAGCKRGASYNVPPEAALEPAAADTVIAWNEHATDALIRTAGQTPPVSLLHLAMVHGAVYDAVNAIDGGYQPYLVAPPAMA